MIDIKIMVEASTNDNKNKKHVTQNITLVNVKH